MSLFKLCSTRQNPAVQLYTCGSTTVAKFMMIFKIQGKAFIIHHTLLSHVYQLLCELSSTHTVLGNDNTALVLVLIIDNSASEDEIVV